MKKEKFIMNKTRKLTAVLGITAAVSVCALGAAFASGSELEATTLPAIQEEGVSQDAENLKYLGVRNYGTLTRMENGQFLLTSSDPDAVNPEMVSVSYTHLSKSPDHPA